ncbi:bifunctional phosphopantothenoylcysteine decarboxylase/phosphopantothenate--cysteine ligase CoaBC [Arachidicoccus ginsenosidivorans]|uniref:bifunctional phosphopantothenoylcysteine decarboxylase/phosphopantothenate--cysteine ligase CoaBC n=1 Tax=Arachidicoccus ginsenosidivorans TaxID=496057 RepID=UPI001CEFA166|nr:bifunctional phosphopantothenoylcysteine decarboxylase/phosphopantothenate--cysteine ligase CoaBC [Arachidicoccus ginsenosidivorans]
MATAMQLKGKKVLLGITGSIAAYKMIILTRLLVKAGAEVKIVMTENATNFVSPLVLSTLSKNAVFRDLATGDSWSNHVALGRWADLMVMAPLSCNSLAKMAAGLCDNLLMAVYLSATCPVLAAPAMDADMWHHPATRANIEKIKSYGHQVLNVNSGELASGLIGEGRMAEPEALLVAIESTLREDILKGKRVLITAGPTHEPLDPVRFIANHSTGKMGAALADAFYNKGAEVCFIYGPGSKMPVFPGIEKIPVTTAADMYEATLKAFDRVDIAVLAAAVADYTPSVVEDKKIKKKEADFNLALVKTKDILKTLGESKQGKLLIGFALETDQAIDNARKNSLKSMQILSC